MLLKIISEIVSAEHAQLEILTHDVDAVVDEHQARHHNNMADVFIIKPVAEGELQGMDEHGEEGEQHAAHYPAAAGMTFKIGDEMREKYQEQPDGRMYLENFKIIIEIGQKNKGKQQRVIQDIQQQHHFRSGAREADSRLQRKKYRNAATRVHRHPQAVEYHAGADAHRMCNGTDTGRNTHEKKEQSPGIIEKTFIHLVADAADATETDNGKYDVRKSCNGLVNHKSG